jgi:hypothetical protein
MDPQTLSRRVAARLACTPKMHAAFAVSGMGGLGRDTPGAPTIPAGCPALSAVFAERAGDLGPEPAPGPYSTDVNGEAGSPSPLNRLQSGLFAQP